MSGIKKYHFAFLLIPVIGLASVYWTHPVVPRAVSPGPGPFTGSAACQSCHPAIYASHIKTAHYMDSRPAAAAFIKGSFRNGNNRFVLNDRMEVALEKKGGRFYQTALFNGTPTQSEAFAIVIGSGRKGQTYLYWDRGRLFQLPISYYAPLDSWCNSPGYSRNMAYFNKQIHGQCMECHGTHAKIEELEDHGTVYDSASILYGIDCERCHGPGAEHVAWHSAHPGELTGKFIVNTKLLSRQQRLDACALCHSGFRKEFKPSFSFFAGDTLANYSSANYDSSSTATLDVHGNQYGLLTASKCFRMSESLDCSTCHDPHTNEYGKMDVYSQRCISCHNGTSLHSCNAPAVVKMGLITNCIDCHMPNLPSDKITFQMSGEDQPVHDLVRTHRVAVYPQISEQWLRAHPKGK